MNFVVPTIRTKRNVQLKRLNMSKAVETNRNEVIGILRRKLAKRQITQEEFDKKMSQYASIQTKNQ